MSINKKILFILSGNLSTTPRALKSIQSLSAVYNSEILLVNRHQIWMEKDRNIIEKLNLAVTILELGRKPFFSWLKATLHHEMSKLLYNINPKSLHINAYASNKVAIVLNNHLKGRDLSKVDIVMGFSEGSLYPCWCLHEKWNIPFIFDIEDYHPGEIDLPSENEEKNRREFIMNSVLSRADAITFASPLIAKYSLDLIDKSPPNKVILNGFNSNEFSLPEMVAIDETTLKIVWFSQKISFGRGLEKIFEALYEIALEHESINIALTLIGMMDAKFDRTIVQVFLNKCIETKVNLIVHEPLAQKELHLYLAKFDIGLAIESNIQNLNRQICLTNKIISYAQSGLFILATNTEAQALFLQDFPTFGKLTNHKVQSIKDSLLRIYDKRDMIRKERELRYITAKQVSWNNEQQKLFKLVNNILYN